MRNNTNKWVFYNLPDRMSLNSKEVDYWKKHLDKILKIGMEFEFNLLKKENGTCKSDSILCPCIHMTDENDCWQKCAHYGVDCQPHEKNTKTCKNTKDGCTDDKCKTCDKYEMYCPSFHCPNFVSACITCTDYERNCNKCAYRFDPNKSPDAIRKKLKLDFKPLGTYGLVNNTGVHSIKKDGSLLGEKGAEIITVGRRIDFWEFFNMSKNIIDNVIEKGGYVNERCSIHMHLLTSYYGQQGCRDDFMNSARQEDPSMIPKVVNEMEKPLPEIVVANFHQLVRRYQNALTWLSMGLDSEDHLTRWEKFRVSILPISATLQKMDSVKSQVAHNAGGNKYGFVNYNNLEFDRAGNVDKFHVEMRGLDAILSPSAIAAMACLYHALIIKAVEISKYGVVEIGDSDWVERSNKIKREILNNTGDYNDNSRLSSTINALKYRDELVEQATDLIYQLKSILIRNGPAYEVLERLTDRPCALRRCAGDTWEDIEASLSVDVTDEESIDILLAKIISLNQVFECKDKNEWTNSVIEIFKDEELADIDNPKERINSFLEKNEDDGSLVWSDRIGAPILI